MKKLVLLSFSLFCFYSFSQTRSPAMGGKPVKTTKAEKPAAQGYIKGKASNKSQDKQLKSLEKEEKEAYNPKPKATRKKDDGK